MNDTDFSYLLSASAWLAGLDLSVIVEHTAVELLDMWKVVRVKYQRALANFTKSGEHDDDFFAYSDGSLECLEIKHDLTSFVGGGMLPEDQFNSLKRGCDSGFEMQSPSSKKMKQEVHRL
ncbi:hypothetical protein PF010_g5998 [Phytophthora fragariae]|uniref:Uncharacterized protein n=1 Tax=Phytophthora fragariae TaxID=53985 RepID=A0A6A3M2J4_9STRA|nr:hypothetical protein PF003_g117 [Phytophthora fragariae]KAE9022614.1 hypothetical protein PF011_g4377 [Phytophthora fragariae]KAE9124450.1 hypothetical protein PF010_g5998 [Phytophthora fragariae]KAE9247153.1 hypothetical protein PF004_g4457 [Phytophthora fragariae]KAE9255051.1 hypothetical protein PF002_g2543 [Phytophthora fragariae]